MPSNSTKIHQSLALTLAFALLSFLILNVLDQHYPDKELYENAEYRFENTPGVRSSDFVIKRENHQFLIAPNDPKELRPAIELAAAGKYFVSIEAEYPDWLCKVSEIDKARLLVRGGSLNESVKLIKHSKTLLEFSAAKSQRLTFRVTNNLNKDCGRAQIEFYRATSSLPLKVGLVALWACLLALCVFSLSSPYIITVGLLANTLYILADASLGSLSTASVLINTGFAVGLTGVLFFIAAIPFRSRLIALFTTCVVVMLVLPALAFIAYEKVFSVPFTVEAIHGALQSYGSQAFEFWKEFVGKKRTLYMLFAIILVYILIRQINGAKSVKLQALILGLLLLVTSGALTLGKLQDSGIYNLILKSSIEYRWEIDAFKKVASQRKNLTTQAIQVDEFKDATTVIVFGESVNKKHMSAYGYVRQTTPLLDKRIKAGEVILFSNAYSSHTHSNPTMSMSLTQANQYASKRWQDSPSIFNYAAAAGVETQWLTNHRLLGGWSNNITTIIREADRLQTINFKVGYGLESTHYDADLVPLFKQAVNERPNQLTLLHLYNSHSYYCNRYPGGFSKFEEKLPLIEFGAMRTLRRTSEHLISCYDNTIHYADTVLEEIIAELDARENPSMLLYVADHAEEFIDGRTHNSAIFTFDMINIPLVVWANDAWRKKHADVWETLNNNRDKVITNDFAFESVLGLSGIEAQTLNVKNDISNAAYVEPKTPLSLYGRVAIDDKNNWNYWQNQNLRFAAEQDLDLIAVNIESLGEAQRALAMGFKHIQINVEKTKENGLVVVGAIENKSVGTVSEFVDFLDPVNSNFSLTSLALKPVSPINDLGQHLLSLEEQTEIKLLMFSSGQSKPIDLSRPDFAQALAPMLSAERNDFIPVTLATRYTKPAPEPD